MTAAIGLERLPRAIADEAAANLIASANRLDALVHGDRSAREEISRSESEGDRILRDLLVSVGGSPGHAVAVLEQPRAPEARVARCRDREEEIRTASRSRACGSANDWTRMHSPSAPT
jgi:hypothetical protein